MAVHLVVRTQDEHRTFVIPDVNVGKRGSRGEAALTKGEHTKTTYLEKMPIQLQKIAEKLLREAGEATSDDDSDSGSATSGESDTGSESEDDESTDVHTTDGSSDEDDSDQETMKLLLPTPCVPEVFRESSHPIDEC